MSMELSTELADGCAQHGTTTFSCSDCAERELGPLTELTLDLDEAHDALDDALAAHAADGEHLTVECVRCFALIAELTP